MSYGRYGLARKALDRMKAGLRPLATKEFDGCSAFVAGAIVFFVLVLIVIIGMMARNWLGWRK